MAVEFTDIKNVAKSYWPTYGGKLPDAACGIIAKKFQRCTRELLNREAGTWFELNTESTKPDWSAIARRCAEQTKSARNDWDRLLERLRNSDIKGRTPWAQATNEQLWNAYVEQEVRLWTHDSLGGMRDIADDDPRRKMINKRAVLMRMQWRSYLQDIGVSPPEFLLERGQPVLVDSVPF